MKRRSFKVRTDLSAETEKKLKTVKQVKREIENKKNDLIEFKQK